MDISPQFLDQNLVKLRAELTQYRAQEDAARKSANKTEGAIEALEQVLAIRNTTLPHELAVKLGLTPEWTPPAETPPIAQDDGTGGTPNESPNPPAPSLADIAGNPSTTANDAAGPGKLRKATRKKAASKAKKDVNRAA